MSKYSAFNVALQGEQMRNAQKLYFQAIAKAKKTKAPEDFQEANRILKISKDLEISFDDTVKEITQNNAGSEIDELLRLTTALQNVRSKLMDNFGLFGGGHKLNDVFAMINEALEEKEVQQ